MAIVKTPKEVRKVRECVRKFRDAWAQNIIIYHDMNEFVNGYQWTDDEEDLFLKFQKMPLTVNKISPKQNLLIGEQAQNTTNLQVLPMDEEVDEKSVEVKDALIKEIMFNSDTKYKFQQCFKQLLCGFTTALTVPEYANNYNFDQVIKIDNFKDPTKCYWDLGSKSMDMTDGEFCGFTETLTREKFKNIYGEDLERKIGYTSSDIIELGQDIKYSFTDEKTITLIHHFKRKTRMKTIYQLSNGETLDQPALDALEKILTEDGKEFVIYNDMPMSIVNDRDIPVYEINHCVYAGEYRLEKTLIPGETLPMPYGDLCSYFAKDGKQIIRPFFKDSVDSQRYLNYLRTNMAYIMKVSRYEQFMASKQNIKSPDTQAMWRDPSTFQGTLYYDESPNGNKPERLNPPELSRSLSEQYMEATQDLHETSGIYPTYSGEQGNEISGDAIEARNRRTNISTFFARNSLDRLIASIGNIVNEQIPFVYDSERTIYLDMKDAQSKRVKINTPIDEYGSRIENDVTRGKYKIRLIPGKSFEEQKQEGVMSMDAVFNKNPETFNLLADLYVENLPMPNNIEMRNRLRTLIPPEIVEAGKTGKPLPPKPPQQDPLLELKKEELQVKMQGMMLEYQAKIQELKIAEDKIIVQSHQAGVDFSKELEKLKVQREELESKMKEQEMRFHAEIMNIAANSHASHQQNVVKVLTHKSKDKESNKSREV